MGSAGGGDKPGGCGKTSVGEKEWKADVDEIANDNDDSCGEIGGKSALMSAEDVDDERDESENTSELMMDVGDEKCGIFVSSISSGSSMFAKSAVK